MDVDYKKLAIKVGYSYLNGGYRRWEDGAGKIHSYESMDDDYLKNCINFVDRGIEELKNDKNGITNIIKKHLSKMIDDPSEKDIKRAKKQITEILKAKKKELKEYKKEKKNKK